MSSPENGIRLEELLDELRATAPPAPERLRARIESIAAAEPAQHPGLRERLSFRRFALVLGPTLVAAGLGVAVIGGISGGIADSDDAADEASPRTLAPSRAQPGQNRDAAGGSTTTAFKTFRSPPVTADREALQLRSRTASAAKPIPPARSRAQEYRASLQVRVAGLDDLSRQTKAAIRATRAWGGYVVAADYDIPASEGDARLELRVPVRHVQAAIQRFSELGTILAQDISIRDVQGRLDRYTRDILALRERIAKLRAQLVKPGVSEAERRTIEVKIARSQRRIAALRADRAGLARQASFATVSLTLTTRDPAAADDEDGRIETSVRDAGGILAKELAYGLYALIVAAPFLLLAAAAVFATRAGRRRADERLLERA